MKSSLKVSHIGIYSCDNLLPMEHGHLMIILKNKTTVSTIFHNYLFGILHFWYFWLALIVLVSFFNALFPVRSTYRYAKMIYVVGEFVVAALYFAFALCSAYVINGGYQERGMVLRALVPALIASLLFLVLLRLLIYRKQNKVATP